MVDETLILTGVALNRDRSKRRQDVLHLRTQELCGGTQRVPVLAELSDISGDMLLLLSGHRELRAFEELADCRSDLDLTRVRARDGVDERREGPARSEHRLSAHCSAHLSEQRQMNRFRDGEGANRSRERGAIQDTEMLLGSQRNGLNVVGRKCLARGHNPAPTESGGTVEAADGRVSNEQACDVRQRRQICGEAVSVSVRVEHRTEVVALTS